MIAGFALLRVLAPYAIGAALVGGAVLAVHSYGASRYAAGVAADKARSDGVINRMVAQAETARAEEDAKQRAEEARRATAQQEIVDAATAEALRLRDARDRAAAAEQRLRGRFAALAASCSGGASPDPASAPGGPSASAPGAVLAGLLERLDGAAGELATYADAARAAGEACVKSYGALTPATAPGRAALPNAP